MAPNIQASLIEPEDISAEISTEEKVKYERKIVWRNVYIMSVLHTLAIYGLYLSFTSAKWQTNLFAVFLYIISGWGITAGAHRLWAHRSYKAKWQLRLLLAAFNCVSLQNDIFEWARDHRVHHKYSETDADPHNATRGFFFSHVGWLLVKKHPDVIKKGKALDVADLWADPIVRFQRRFYLPLVALFCFVLPTYIPSIFWNDSKWNAYFICGIFRYAWTLNMTWLVNSAAHMWGNRPFDKHINPRENKAVVVGAIGEGFHNYHHTFPWDYATSELGWKFNLTTMFIDFFAWVGWAYDRKVVTPAVIKARKERTGDNAKKVN